MGTRADYVAALAQAMLDAGEQLAGLTDHPISPIPGTPSVQVVPGDPYLVPDGAGFRIRLEPMLFAGRLDEESAMATMDRLLPIVTGAAAEAELRWLQTTVRTVSVSGVEYVSARSTLEGETLDP